MIYYIYDMIWYDMIYLIISSLSFFEVFYFFIYACLNLKILFTIY